MTYKDTEYLIDEKGAVFSVNSNDFLYFIGDTFSLELFAHMQKFTQLKLISISQLVENHRYNQKGFIYTPSVNFKERLILEVLPRSVKRIAILDAFHFDFKDFQKSFETFPPDLIFSPVLIESFLDKVVVIPSIIKAIYSKSVLPKKNQSDFQSICFISQPLQEERSLPFNQHDIIARIMEVLKDSFPGVALFVKPHPREDSSIHQQEHLLSKGPEEVLQSFDYFIGFNSALLYAADGLGKASLKCSSISDIHKSSIEALFNKKLNIFEDQNDPISMIVQRINNL